MTSDAGLDVSRQETRICVVDATGAVRWSGKARSEPAAPAVVRRRRAPDLERAVPESGASSGWLRGGLVEAGLPVVCIDARAAHGALKRRRGKTDRGDAEGLARLARTGWYKVARPGSRASLERRALLAARERLVRIQRDPLDRIRGLAKPLGLILPRATPRRLPARVQAWPDEAPGMRPAVTALLAARSRVAGELERLDRLIVRQAAADPVCRRLTTIPGVGAITAACCVSVVDDPGRFARADQVAAYLGSTPRRWPSGEADRQGGIPKTGDAMARHLLHEVATACSPGSSGPARCRAGHGACRNAWAASRRAPRSPASSPCRCASRGGASRGSTGARPPRPPDPTRRGPAVAADAVPTGTRGRASSPQGARRRHAERAGDIEPPKPSDPILR